MMNYSRNYLLGHQIFHKFNLMFSKNIFIRSINKPKAGEINPSNLLKPQPYTTYFVLDFEATCDNGPNLLKPQVMFL